MTDKQIIIDGVDVSGCDYYVSNGECTNKNVYPDYCKPCSNCTYKLEQQLKRKEQECETLASQLDFEVQKKECLEKECKELKKQLMQKSDVDMFFNTPIEGWSNDPCGICKYKNCLTEIKEITEHSILLDCNECPMEDYCEELCSNENNFQEVILQKINECEVCNDMENN